MWLEHEPSPGSTDADERTWRQYSAEHPIPLGEPLDNLAAVRRLVQQVKRSAWWRRTVSDQIAIRSKFGDATSAYCLLRPTVASLLATALDHPIHPDMRNDLVVFHELAHCVTPGFEAKCA